MLVPIRLGSAIAVARRAWPPPRFPSPPRPWPARSTQHWSLRAAGRHAVSCRPTTRRTRSWPTTGRRRHAQPGRARTPPAGSAAILAGSVVDHLASQGSLSYDPRARRCFYAVNAAATPSRSSRVHGDRLAPRQVLSSGGSFPVSVAVRGDLVYVLNALAAAGCRLPGRRRRLISGPRLGPRARPDPTATPAVHQHPGPGRVLSRRGQLIVTTKANGNDIDVFGVRRRPPRRRNSGRAGSVRDRLRLARPPGHRRGRHQRPGHVLAAPTPVTCRAVAASATCWVAPAPSFPSNAAAPRPVLLPFGRSHPARRRPPTPAP